MVSAEFGGGMLKESVASSKIIPIVRRENNRKGKNSKVNSDIGSSNSLV